MRYFDKYGFILDSSNTVDEGRGDSIGTLSLMYLCTGDKKYLEPLFLTHEFDYLLHKFQLYRHPDYIGKRNDISRDHTIYWVMALIQAYNKKRNILALINLRVFLKYRKWKVSDKFCRTIDMWIWENIVLRKVIKITSFNKLKKIFLASKIWDYVYYIIMIPQMFITMLWNKLIRFLFKLDKEEIFMLSSLDESFCGKENYNKWAKLLFPAYARHIAAWQLYLLPDSIGKKILQWIYIKMDVGNAVIRGLCGKTLLAKILDIIYNPVTGYRWSTELNNTSDRHMVHYRDNDIMPDKTVLRYVALLP